MHGSSSQGADVVGVDILSDVIVGRDGGFMAIRRLELVNIRSDGTRSAKYLVDFLVRPKGTDAVVVGLWTRAPDGRVRVLLRDGLRPSMYVGRGPDSPIPVPDAQPYLFFREVVAGIIEPQDRGEEGVRRRAAAEVEEEAGYRVTPDQVKFLGAGTFPSAGAMPERFWLTAVEIPDPAANVPLMGDGSPMEEGARTLWMDLDEAIAACVAGKLEDAKTELTLRRLKDFLRS